MDRSSGFRFEARAALSCTHGHTRWVPREWTPNAKYSHVFVVIRLDDFHDADAALESRFHVNKVLLTEEAAEREAARLNAVNSDKDCRYVVHVARLDER